MEKENEGRYPSKDSKEGLMNGNLNFNLDEPDDSFITGATKPPTQQQTNQYNEDEGEHYEEHVHTQYVEDFEDMTDEEILASLSEEEQEMLEGVIPEEQADYIRALRSQIAPQQMVDEEEYHTQYQLTEEEQMHMLRVKNLKTKKKIITFSALAIAALAVAISSYIYFFTDIIKDNSAEEIPLYEEQLTELISLMYNAKDVEELASANPTIVGHFDSSISASNDIRDSNVYAERYGYFYNAPISVKVNEVSQFNEHLFIRYTIECELTSPLTRIALVTINTDGKITRFTEYNTY